MHTNSPRETALRVLIACRTNGSWADAALPAQLNRDGLQGPDAALCSHIVYGVMQRKILLDFYLSAYCSQKLEQLQPPLWDILRIGAYQILFLDKVPDSAAVNTSVELTKKWKRAQAAGLVNAVLRRISREKEALPPVPEKNEVQYLSIRYSYPKWLVKRLLPLLGRQETEAFLTSGNTQPPITAQVNTLRCAASSLQESLLEEGVHVQAHPWLPDCLLLFRAGGLERLKSFQEGAFYVQDPAARLMVLASGLRAGMEVLDLCAAPGGKSFAASIAMGGKGRVLSCDLHEKKLKRVEEGAARLGISCMETAAGDGRVFRPDWEKKFDVVLVDAPCSGLGIIRKKPDIRYKKPDSFLTLPVVQSALLANAARYVRLNGTLVYSTCTVLPEENQQVTDAFLAEHPNFSRETFRLPGPVGEAEGQITLWPHRHETDGFYICRMRRHT